MNRNWKWFLPGYVLALPGTLIGLVLLLWYGRSEALLREGVINVVIKRQYLIGGRWVGAQTYGNVVFYRDHNMLAIKRLRVHEHTHVWQAMVFTWPIMAIWYGLQYFFGRVAGFNHYDAYHQLDWEQHARETEKVIEPHEWGAWT